MSDAAALPIVRTDLESLTEAVYTLAAVHFVLHEALAPDQAALRVVVLRHEVRDVLATWTPPRDSYRAQDLASMTTFAAEQPPGSGYRVRWEIGLDAPETPIAAAIEAQQIMRDPASMASVFAVTAPDGTTELIDLLAHDSSAGLHGGEV
jgi:hypothetical protein